MLKPLADMTTPPELAPSEEIRVGALGRYRIMRALAGSGDGTLLHEVVRVDEEQPLVLLETPTDASAASSTDVDGPDPAAAKHLVIPVLDRGVHEQRPFLVFDPHERIALCLGAYFGWDPHRLELLASLVAALRAARDAGLDIVFCGYETLAVSARRQVRFMSPLRLVPADARPALETRYCEALRQMLPRVVRTHFSTAPPSEQHRIADAPPDGDTLIWCDELHASHELRELLDDLMRGRLSSLDASAQAIEAFGTARAVRKRTGWATHRGKVRAENEDALMLLAQAVVAGDRSLRAELYAVADGMGGHEAGEIASEITLKSLAVELVGGLNITSATGLGRDVLDHEFLAARVREAIDRTNDTVRRYAGEAHAKSRRKPGSTLVCALTIDAVLTIGHVGDSRAYKIAADGTLRRITRDHSPVQELVDRGALTLEAAFVHPHRNQISSNIGMPADLLTQDVTVRMLRVGEAVLLCSDGLNDMLMDGEIEEICRRERDPRRLARALVDAACERGGHDNVSALVVMRGPAPSQDERKPAPPSPA